MFHPPPAVEDGGGLLRRGLPHHSRRRLGCLMRHGPYVSTFLRPLAPRALPRFMATTDTLTPAGRLFGPSGAMNTGLSSTAGLPVYLVHSSNRSAPNHPTVSPSVICFRSRFISERRGRPVDPVARGAQREVLPRGFGSRLRTAVAGSPIGLAESDSRSVMSLHVMSLRTGCSSPAASHPVLPRRSSLRLQTGERSV